MNLRKPLGAVLTAALLAAALLVLRPGERASADLNPAGAWHIDVSGDVTASCSADFTLAGADVSAGWSCGPFGSGTLTGTLTKDGSGSKFHIRGEIHQASIIAYFYADGTVDDANSMSGTWFGEFDILTGSGAFSGVREGAPTPEPTDTPTITPTSTPVPPTDTPGGPTPSPTFTPPPPPMSEPGVAGDANCDGQVNSIDAAVTLQYGAALLQTLPCAANANVNGDGMVNAIDVTLILQYGAGLLSRLPV